MEKVEVYSSFRPLFNNSKIFFIPFEVVPSINHRYYLSDYPEIIGKKIRGIDAYSDAKFTPTIEINGVLYNVISQSDTPLVQLSIYNTIDEPILYRSPLSSFYRESTIANNEVLELKDYADLLLDTGQSYFEFVSVAFVTPFPMVIPLKFIW